MLLGGSGGLVAAKFVMCPKSYYTEQFEIRDIYDTTYNTPTPYDPSLVCIIKGLTMGGVTSSHIYSLYYTGAYNGRGDQQP